MAIIAMLPQLGHATASTHIWAPSTDIQAYRVWHITSDAYMPTEPGPATVTNMGLTVGVLPFQKLNLELGFDHKTGLGLTDRYPMYYNAKLGVPENTFGKYFPAIAAGIFDLGTKSFDDATGLGTNYNVLYGKVAKTFSPLGRFSLGYFFGNEDLLLDDKGEQDNSGVMAAWERTVTELSDKLWVCAEYMGTESVYGTLNFGAAWKFANNVGVILGYDIYNNSNFTDTVTLQVDIDFNCPFGR